MSVCWSALKGFLCRLLELSFCAPLLPCTLPRGLLELLAWSVQLRKTEGGLLLSAFWTWWFLQAGCWGNDKAHLIFSPLSGITVVQPDSRCLKPGSPHYMLSHVLVISGRRVNLVPVTPSWWEAEVPILTFRVIASLCYFVVLSPKCPSLETIL